ncbi:MAG: NACHT and WD repeat domain-containing protein [Pseudonocardiaceae bacterium]
MAGVDPPELARMREGIRATVVAWGRGAGQGFRRGGPWAIVGALVAGAIAPVVWPLAGAAGISAVLGALVGQAGNVGAGYLVEVITKALDRARRASAGESSPEQLREAIDAELQALIRDGHSAVGLRREVAALLRAIGGIDTAVSAAVQTGVAEIQQTLFAAFTDLGGSVTEFAWMLDQTRQSLIKIQHEQARQGVEQRHQTDLARENLTKTNLVIQRLELLIGVPSGEPTEDQAIGSADPASEQPAPGPCPYMGLRSFRAEDTLWFFGRERLTANLFARLVEAPLLAVVGASGSGKSSLLGAGLLPAAWAGTVPGATSWITVALTPTSHPLEELASRIALLRGLAAGGLLTDLRADPRHLRLAIRQILADAPTGARLLVIIDQVEEIFTLCHDDTQRQAFLDALAALAADPGGGAAVVLGIRADFYPRCAEHPPLAAALQDHQLLVTPMTVQELREAITSPAQRAGLVLEPGLVETILADLGEEPGSLPLLSHALSATWQRRRGKTLTGAGYRDAGGVRQAIAQTADTVYKALTPAQQTIAKDIFLRLTALGEGTEDTRRRAQRTELISGQEAAEVQRVLDTLATARLVTLDQDSTEVAHEALIREWPRLRGWLDEDREGLRLAQRLTTTAHDWAASGRDDGALYRGTRLADTRAWIHRAQTRLSAVENEFLHASITQEDIERRAKRHRTQVLAAALVLALIAFASATGLYIHQRNQTRLTQANQLAAESTAQAVKQPDMSMLLAVEAFHHDPTTEALSALLSAQSQFYAGQLTGHDSVVTNVAFSPDGRILASGSYDNTAKLWDMANHRLITTLTDHTGVVRAVVFSPDGRTLATASDDHRVKLWAMPTGRLITTLTGHKSAVLGVAFSPDGHTLATASDDGTAKLWDVTSRQVIATLTGHTDTVGGVAFSPNGRTLATASDDGTVKLWDVTTGRLITSLAGHIGALLGVAFSPDGHTLASAGFGGIAQLWEVATGRLLVNLPGHPLAVSAVAFSPDGHILATASLDGTTKLWEVATGQLLTTLADRTGSVNGVAFSPDGRTLATASNDTTVKLWNLAGPILISLPHVADFDVAFSPDGRNLAVAITDGTAELWDMASRKPLRSFNGFDLLGAVTFSPDERTLATAGFGGAQLWEVATGRLLTTLAHQTGSKLNGVVFSPDGHILATSSAGSGMTGEDGFVQLWDVTTSQLITTFTIPTVPGERFYAVAFSPDGHTLATAGNDGTVRLWDVGNHRLITTLIGHTNTTTKVAFSPDGHTLASTSSDNTTKLWDMTSHHLITTLNGHTNGGIVSVAYSPDGRTLATSSGDGAVQLWDVANHQLSATLTGHTGAAVVAFSPDGKTLATTGFDGTVRLWDIDADWVTARLCRIIGAPSRVDWARLIPQLPYQPTCR